MKIVEKCIEIIENSNKKDKEKHLYLFLDEVFSKNKQLSRDYHEMQIELYCKFNQDKLLLFLQQTEAYEMQRAIAICQQYNRYQEECYLLNKMGNEKEAIKVLIDKCTNVSEAMQIAIKFNIKDENLWNSILEKTMNKTENINSLLEFIDIYTKPVIHFL